MHRPNQDVTPVGRGSSRTGSGSATATDGPFGLVSGTVGRRGASKVADHQGIGSGRGTRGLCGPVVDQGTV